MDPFTTDQKMAMLVVPLLLFGMLGVSYASAAGRNLSREEESVIRRTYHHNMSEGRSVPPVPHLRDAIESESYDDFVVALRNTPYEESASKEVFNTLVSMYALHTSGKHADAGHHLHRALYGE